VVPRTVLLGGKAAPDYRMAKRIIELAHAVAAVVDRDPAVAGRLRLVFPANFDVSLAERIYPAADLSEQISLAGKEASGTGNMKLALNGAITIGTLDGANVEILERVGEDSFFLFGLTVEEVLARRASGYRPRTEVEDDAELARVLGAIAEGRFSDGDRDRFRPIVEDLLERDPFMVLADFRAYLECVGRALDATRDVEGWTRRSILNTARCGFFSSDRSIRDYCERIWKVSPVRVG
jgi:starch phosphorylase